MSQSSRWIGPLCLASVLWAFSFGLNAPLASLWMHDAHCSDTQIGENTGVYYLGIALTAGFVPFLMRRWGFGCLLLGMFASALTAAAFPWGGGLFGWFLLRILNGGAAALSLIPLETLVNHRSPSDQRARNFGCYAFCIALGMALGTLVGLEMYPCFPRLAFVLGGMAALLAGVVVLCWQPLMTVEEEHSGEEPLQFARNSLSFGSAWSQGFLEGGMVALLPIYLLSTGLSQDSVSWLMSGLMIGVILAQVPVSWLADRLGRSAVLIACNLVALLGIGCLMLPCGIAWLSLWLFVVGASSGAFYPLGLALLGERVPPGGLARASSWYLGINCVGSMTGPVIAGAFMDWFGRGTLFLAGGGAIVLTLALWIILGCLRAGNSGSHGATATRKQVRSCARWNASSTASRENVAPTTSANG
jgi:MFS family permease